MAKRDNIGPGRRLSSLGKTAGVKIILVCLSLLLMATGWANEGAASSELTGQVVVSSGYFESLQNAGGENPNRDISVYLPPGYQSSNDRYPVVYFLPGFGSTHASIMQALAPLVDTAIIDGRIDPLIVVVPDHYTSFRGSYFSDSPVNGNWVRFTVDDVVSLVDSNYRTLANRDSRGLAGWSSGAYGAVKIGMLHPEVYSSIYSMSPGILALTDEFGPGGEGFKRAGLIESREELTEDWDELFANLVVAMGRAFSPNPENPPFLADLPYTYEDDKLNVHDEILDKWQKHVPIRMLSQYDDNFRSLKAFKLDWGRNDEYQNVITACKRFSLLLEEMGIEHEAEEYIGKHSDKIFIPNGRISGEMLPFFQRNLTRDSGEMAAQLPVR